MRTATGWRVAAATAAAIVLFFPGRSGAEESGRGADFYLRLGDSFMDTGQYERALTMFEKAGELDTEKELNGRLSVAHEGVADNEMEKGNYADAVGHYEAAGKYNPASEIASSLADAYGEWGRALLGSGGSTEALEKLDKALALTPGDSGTRRLMAETLLKRGRLEEALAQYEKLSRGDQDNTDMGMKLAFVNEKLDRGGEAVTHYEALIKRDPKYVPAYEALGQYYEKRGSFLKAEEVFREGIKNAPGNASLHVNLCWIQINRDNYLEAYRECSTALDLDDGISHAYNYLGLILTHINQYDKARETFEKALELDPGNDGARMNYAFLFGLMERHEDAIREYKRVLDNNPDNPEAQFNIGMNYKKEGRYLLAQYHLERAAKLYGYDSTLGKRALERLDKLDQKAREPVE